MVTPTVIPAEMIRRVAERERTPFYLYDRAAIGRNYSRLAAIVPAGGRLFYSMKANPNPRVVQLLAEAGAGVEVASAGELRIALSAGVASSSIVFAGPGKSGDELELAVREGILALNVESTGELARTEAICRRLGMTVDVAIRINPIEGVSGAGMSMGGRPSCFGIDAERVEEALDAAASMTHLRTVGVHVYVGTQILDSGGLRDHLRRVLTLGRSLAARYSLYFVNVGGGFGVPLWDGQAPLDLALVGEGLTGADGVRVFVESGRYLLAGAGCYVAEIVDIKPSRGERFVVLNGGVNHFSRALGASSILRRNPRMRFVGAPRSADVECVNIVGPLCSSADRLGEKVQMPVDARIGDLVVIDGAGAYGFSHSPVTFLSHDWPAEYFLDDGDYTCISRRITAMDILALRRQEDANV